MTQRTIDETVRVIWITYHSDFSKRESGQYGVMNCLFRSLHSLSAFVENVLVDNKLQDFQVFMITKKKRV